MFQSLHRLALLMLTTLPGSHLAVAEVTFERSQDQHAVLKKFTIDSGKAELSMFRAIWSNTNLTTQSGQQVSVIDPFMYHCEVLVRKQQEGGYWSAKDIWDRWQVDQVKNPHRPYTDIVKIVAEPPGWGVRKEVSISVHENQSTAYVFSRLVATENIQLIDDNQTIYVDTSIGNRFYVDGVEIRPDRDRKIDIARWIMIYYWNEYVSVGLIAMDPELQAYPNHQIFGDVMFSESDSQQGASISLRKGSGAMAKGASRTQQYVLMWGDGDLRSKIEETSKKALAGELNSNVFPLPAVK